MPFLLACASEQSLASRWGGPARFLCFEELPVEEKEPTPARTEEEAICHICLLKLANGPVPLQANTTEAKTYWEVGHKVLKML